MRIFLLIIGTILAFVLGIFTQDLLSSSGYAITKAGSNTQKPKPNPDKSETLTKAKLEDEYFENGKIDKHRIEAQKYIADLLRDPESAKFRKLVAFDHGLGIWVFICGEVKGRNGYGGYSNWIPFYYGTAEGRIYSKDDILFRDKYTETCRKQSENSNVYFTVTP